MTIEAEGLVKGFRSLLGWHAQRPPAVSRVSLFVDSGEAVALVGESGSGKTTVGRILLGLLPPDEGHLRVAGLDPYRQKGHAWRDFCRRAQWIPQHPESALNPRWSLFDSIAEPLRALGLVDRAVACKTRIDPLAERLGLRSDVLARRPFEVSGGEAQRALVIRALAVNPAVLVADEPTSMLDAPIQAAVLQLLREWREQHGTTLLFTTHDLHVAAAVAERIAVMKEGAMVEQGPAADVLERPTHPYVQQLVAAAAALRIPAPSPRADAAARQVDPFPVYRPDGQIRP